MEALTVPFWGMEDAPGKVVAWLVSEGQTVTRGQEIVEIETSKLTNVVESPLEGVLLRQVLAVGESAPGGSLLGVIAKEAPDPAALNAFIAENAAKAPDERGRLIEVTVPTAHGDIYGLARPGKHTLVVLLHGFGSDHKSWQALINRIDSPATLLALDLPGHGNSFMALGDDPVTTLVEALSEGVMAYASGPIHLVGHSFGGLLALKWAAERPERIASLSLVAPAGLGSAVNADFLEAFANADNRKAARAALEMVVGDPGAVNLAAVNDLLRARRLEGASTALNSLRMSLVSPDGTQRIDLRSALGSLNLPKTVIWGEADPIVAMPQTLDGVEIERLSGGSHLIHVERAGEVAQRVNAVIAATGIGS